MQKSYRTHQEQIEKVAKSLKELYYAPRSGQPTAVRQKSEQKGRVSRLENLAGTQKRVWTTHPVKTPGIVGRDAYVHSPGSSPLTVPAMRCTRCNTRFPKADYLYTKKSGLCITCWEAKVV
jgi:hypothetical protein